MSGNSLNVVNNSADLFARYVFFRDRYKAQMAESLACERDITINRRALEDGSVLTSGFFPSQQLKREAEWNARAAVEAFFSWTEHAFIHIAILLCRLKTGEDVARLAASDWKSKFQTVIDLADATSKRHYDNLLDLRAQMRNFVAHGSFGKRGEAFSFHSGAGAVPVLLTRRQLHRYSLNGRPTFTEESAIAQIEDFLKYLWSGPRLPARQYLESEMPTILTHVDDGTYATAMTSLESMSQLVDYLVYQSDCAANMDF